MDSNTFTEKLNQNEKSRTIRLTSSGTSFDFDLLRLAKTFPSNVLSSLITNTNEISEDGVRILRTNFDVQSMRIIYAYYNTYNLIIPENQIDRELLLNTCDYYGFVEFVFQIQLVLMREDNFEIEIESKKIIETPNIEYDENYIDFVRPEVIEPVIGIEYEINPKCALSDLDKNILTKETLLRKAYAHGSKPQIPRVDFIKVDKATLQINHPYTFVHSPKRDYLTNMKWVDSVDEFIANLKIYSLGIIDETLPANLIVAGSSALKCAMHISSDLLNKKMVEKFAHHFESYDENTDDYLVFNSIQRRSNEDIHYPEDKLDFLAKMIVFHANQLQYKINNLGEKSNSLKNAVKSIAKNQINFRNDIDLFICGEDSNEILNSINFIHKKLIAKFTNVYIIRTAHAVSFVTDNPFMPAIQIILRAYDSVEHVVLGFDIDSCCIGYDGNNIICSDRFIRAIRYGYNLIDTTRLSLTYETRLMKYFRRGFSIAMIEPTIKERTETLLQLMNKHTDLAFFSIIQGIYRLSYLLIQYYKLARLPRIEVMPDYGRSSITSAIKALRSGVEKLDFVFGMDLDKVLFEGVSEIQDANVGDWQFRRYCRRVNAKINKDTILPPIRVMRKNVTKQTDSDELFTGSFNPIQLAWYEGSFTI